MVRKVFILLTILTILSVTTIKTTYASEKGEGKVNLSDEIYADLALRNALNHVSLYYFDGNIDNTVSINADKAWNPASTIKLYVAMYAFDQVAAGKISLDQLVTIDDKNVAPAVSVEGGYAPLSAGQQVTVYEILDRMITQSGNTSYNTLLDLLDRREITKYIHDLGLTSSSIGGKLNLSDAQEALEANSPGFGENITTADDFARAFILINGKRIPGSPSLFDMLSRQKLNDMIPAKLPAGVIVAHKTGELDPFYHDGGIIVDPNKRYILSIFSDGGDPSLVAHISQLVYTEDSSLIGATITNKVGEAEPLPPLDPLVAEANGEQVLAATTQNQNFTLPPITASDIGVGANDVNSVLDSKQLPPVIIPKDSPLHFLVDLGSRINSLNPIAPFRVGAQASSLKLKLSEANDLLSRGKNQDANQLLSDLDTNLAAISKDKSLSANPNAQVVINQVSETRFNILKGEFTSLNGDAKNLVIKEIARQARNTANNVVPNIPAAVQKESLTQAPIVGKIVSTTTNSITIETSKSNNVTIQTDTQVKTRDQAKDNSEVKAPTEIPVGTVVALAGLSEDKQKTSFIMTNVPVETSTQTPVSVIKVDIKGNILVVSKNGVPTQVDITKQTVIKGQDDSISLRDIVPGDVLLVHGPQINPVTGQVITASPSPSPQATSHTTTTQPTAPLQNNVTPAPATTKKSQPSSQAPVIKGTVIQVVNTSTPARTPEKKKAIPAPAPAAPAPKPKDDKKN